jgi:hypothetical protein
MNKLFIIGNGFDLAHGLKTSYSDFFLWYLNKSIAAYHLLQNEHYIDPLITIKKALYYPEPYDSLKDIWRDNDSGGNKISVHGWYFRGLLGNRNESNWVDIEYEYYTEVVKIYQDYKRNKDKTSAINAISDLNNCFQFIKDQLLEYLLTIPNGDYNDYISDNIKDELNQMANNDALFLIFNYTKTIFPYLEHIRDKSIEIIYIHGHLNNDKNPIIFGYGDEMDENYQGIENLNMNEFLRNMKSFNYMRTDNYRRLNSFIEAQPYDAIIMGHSCGLSDRVLLKSIFCDANCKEIKIYYYKKDSEVNDHFEKTQEISRHFPQENKHDMRIKILPFEKSSPLA